MFLFFQTGTPLKSIIDTWKETKKQPNLVCIGDSSANLDSFFIVCDRLVIPLDCDNSTNAIDLLFKTHYVLGTEYDSNLSGLWKFIQVFIYELEADTTVLPPKAKKVYGQLATIISC